MPDTVLDRIVQSLRGAAERHTGHKEPPVAVLWPDGAEEWRKVAPLVARRLPLLTLGDYDPAKWQGPAIWVRCVLAGRVEPRLPEGEIPVVYLPGVSRGELRAVEDCPAHLAPLASLQYLADFWTHPNGRDWTLAGFLKSTAGLGVDVSEDQATLDALRNAAEALVRQTVENLQREAPLRAEFFHGLLAPDLPREVLLWLDHPKERRGELSPEEWRAFRERCRQQLDLDPEKQNPVGAALSLGRRQGAWHSVWRRFCEAPDLYPGIASLLRAARDSEARTLFDGPSESWPQDNEQQETALRKALTDIGDRPETDAAALIRELEAEHGSRREWVWARLGQSPLATALRHLAEMADALPSGGLPPSLQDQADLYFREGWKIDLWALRAMGAVSRAEDMAAVCRALSALYVPWLQRVCGGLQAAWSSTPPGPDMMRVLDPEPGSAVVFVDGLRMDAARWLAEKLEREGVSIEWGWRPAPVPTVTATAKPVAAGLQEGLGPGPEFSPTSSGGSALTAEGFRQMLSQKGFAILGGDETGDPSGSCWKECGRLDEIGHIEGRGLAARLEQELDQICRAIRGMLDAGWRKVRVVTDHGWLLSPVELPPSELAETATVVRKGRCARMKDTASRAAMEFSWWWDPVVRIAVAPHVSSFVRGKHYEHGGISPQESILPELIVTRRETRPAVSIVEISWTRLRCRIKAEGSLEGVLLQLRSQAGDPGSVLSEREGRFDESGQATVLCRDETYEGEPVFLCIVEESDPRRVLAQRRTVVGGE